ncbi:hypothetical protein PIROE2DRAFT_65087, partial [Piromyces sp. E2]
EKKHAYDKSLDKYETVLNKYLSASKSKDPTALAEMYNQAEEMKKKFITNGIELCECTIAFKTRLNQLIYNLFNFFYNEVFNYHTSILNSFDSVKPDFNNFKSKLDENISYYNKMKETFENDSTAKPKYEKSGWLFKKYQKGWNRRYFSIKKGVFKYSMTSSSGKKRGFVWTSTPINILLCEVKEEPNNDRRFCFSVITAKKTYILQAENEKELKEWLSAFDIAKHEKLKNLSNTIEENQKPNDVADNVSDDEVKIEDEDEDGEYLTRSFKGQINSIHLTPNVIIYQNEQYENRNKEFHAIFEDVKEDEYLIYNCSCAMQHGVTIQGSIFLTIDYIYFYSKIFKYVTKYKIPFRDVVSINSQTGVVYNVVAIKTNENENNEQLNAQEIFDKIYEADEISDDSESIDESMIENLNETENNSVNLDYVAEENDKESTDKKKNGETEKKEIEVEKIEPSKLQKEIKPNPTSPKIEPTKVKEKDVDTKKADTSQTSPPVSNKNKYILPPNIPKPSGPIVFNEVLERKVKEVILPIPAKQLNDILFGEDISLQQKIRDRKKEFDAIKSPTLKGLTESAEGTLSVVIAESERLASMDDGGAGEGGESANNGSTLAPPTTLQSNRPKSMILSYDDAATPESTEEKSIFNLITIIVSSLLAISIILNIILLVRGGKSNASQTITITPKVQITHALDYCTELLESNFKPWNDILTLELGNSHSKSIERFLDTHFKRPFIQDLGGDTVFNIDNVKSPSSNQPKNFTYYNKDNSLMFFKFQESYNNIRNMKKEIVRTYHDLDSYENKLIIMEYFNWFSDLLEKCIDNDRQDNNKQTANPEDIADLYDKDGNINSAQFVKLPNGKILKKKLKIASCYFELRNALEKED